MPLVPNLTLSLVDANAHDDLPARSTLRRWVSSALENDAQLTLVFVNARVGRKLNRDYRGRDYATNVLTFAYETVASPDVSVVPIAPKTSRRSEKLRTPVAPIHADIVLCMPVVRREAREQGKTLRAHLAHLVIHGVLHAQGHDHERDRDARRMQAIETRLLAALRIGDPYAAVP
jgi:probable rRNA maturation factor